MKKTILGIALIVALLGSCALQSKDDSSGSITMKFAVRAADGGTDASSVRVWVYSSNVLLENTDSTDYHSADFTNGTGTITIKDLPPGDDYRLVVAVGTASGTHFSTVKYGMSPTFSVQTGVETGVSMTLANISATYNASVGSLKSLAVIGDTIYAAASSSLYTGTSIATLSSTAWDPSRGTVNSLSLGYHSSPASYFPLVNTTNGVYDVTTLSAPVMKGDEIEEIETDNGDPEANPGVLQSGSYDDVFFYQGERQFGGLTGTKSKWTKIELDIAGLSGKPIMDFFVEGNPNDTANIYGFFATKFIGAFRIGKSFIDSEPDITDVMDKDNPFFQFFGEDLPLIQALGYTGDTPKTMYLGTKNGAYVTTASFSTSALGQSPTLVPGTIGLDITKIVTRLESGTPVVAMLSADELIVVKGSVVFRMPYVTGLVGTLSDITWIGTRVLLAGDLGIGEVETSGL